MRKAISIIIIIALVATTIAVVTCFTTVIVNAETQDYYYFETANNIYGFGINQCNKYYVHDFNTPASFVIENGDIPNEQIKEMIKNNPVFEQRLISQDGVFTYDIKLHLKNDSFSFSSAAYAYKANNVDSDGNDTILTGEPIIITGVSVDVIKIELYISYNDYYLDVNYSDSDSFFRIYNNKMAANKYWSTSDGNYGFNLANVFNIVDYNNINSDFFLNVKKDSSLKNDSAELTDESMFIYPFSLDAGLSSYRNFINDVFGILAPNNNNKFFNTDTIISGYINIDGVYTERNAEYVGKNDLNNRQIWKLDLPINIDNINEVETLKFTARKETSLAYISTDIIPLPAENIIINNDFSWGSLLELTGIFGVAVDLILQILNYEILGIELGFLIFAPLLFTISLGIIKRIRG